MRWLLGTQRGTITTGTRLGHDFILGAEVRGRVFGTARRAHNNTASQRLYHYITTDLRYLHVPVFIRPDAGSQCGGIMGQTR